MESYEKRKIRLSKMIERNKKAKSLECPVAKRERLKKQRLQKAKKRAEQNINVNSQDKVFGQTALHQASKNGKKSIFNF